MAMNMIDYKDGTSDLNRNKIKNIMFRSVRGG